MTTKPPKRKSKTPKTPKTRDNGGKARAEALVARFMPKELPEESPGERPYERIVPPGVAKREADLIYGLVDALRQCLECNGKLNWSAEHDSELALRRFQAWKAAARVRNGV